MKKKTPKLKKVSLEHIIKAAVTLQRQKDAKLIESMQEAERATGFKTHNYEVYPLLIRAILSNNGEDL